MNCPQCNALIPEDAAFCGECGYRVETPAPAPEAPVSVPQAFCGGCGEPMMPDDTFCGNCGWKKENGPAPEPEKKTPVKVPVKALIIGAAAVAVIAVVVLVVALISGGSGDSYALYIKDDQLQSLAVPGGKEAMEITSELLDGGDDDRMNDLYYYYYYYVMLSDDGSRLFYPDEVETDSYGDIDEYTLYCRDPGNSKREPVKIDSGLSGGYSVNQRGDLVTYVKDGKLYQHDLKEKTKIAGDVDTYRVSEDGKTLLYLVMDDDDTSGDLYLMKNQKEAEKIASDVTSLAYVSDDLSRIFYYKDYDALYLLESGREAVKIASDCYIVAAYDSGACYYVISEESEVSWWSFMEDDLDSAYYDYEREWLQEEMIDNPVSTLCYFDGKESTVITESMVEYRASAADSPVVVYTALENGELPVIKFSEYVEEYDFYTLYYDALSELVLTNVATGTSVAAVEVDDIYEYGVALTADGKTAYLRADYDLDDDTYSLYKLSLSGGKIAKTELYAEDVCYSRLLDDDCLVYWLDEDDYAGELYLNGVKIDDDVYFWSMRYDSDNDKLYYMVDYDEDEYQGTLTCYNGKKAETIKDDVYTYDIAADGTVLFLYDRSRTSGKCELWSWNGRKVQKLDEDVLGLYIVGN